MRHRVHTDMLVSEIFRYSLRERAFSRPWHARNNNMFLQNISSFQIIRPSHAGSNHTLFPALQIAAKYSAIPSSSLLPITSGALVKYHGGHIYKAEFSKEETRRMIAAAREVCGAECEITIDTVDAHYWNYKIDPRKQDQSWGDSIYTD